MRLNDVAVQLLRVGDMANEPHQAEKTCPVVLLSSFFSVKRRRACHPERRRREGPAVDARNAGV